MGSKNICKFVPPTSSGELEVQRFIYESSQEIMRMTVYLECHRAILVIQGEGIFQFNNTRVPFKANCLVFGFQKESLTVIPEKDCEYMYINFAGARAEELFRRFGISVVNRCFDNFESMVPLWRNSLSRATQDNIDLAAESMLLYAFSYLKVENVQYNNLVQRIIDLTEERFNDSGLSITAIAEELGYNAKYLSHFFKEKMGMGYSDYLRNLRINYAVCLFDNGIDSVKNVAILSGFSDPLYFSTVFKKQMGSSPTEYKMKAAKVSLD